ncbi:MAG: hypothetical protein AMXMBFR84_49480 [Candidatus Hydrogenedentota bacterium]
MSSVAIYGQAPGTLRPATQQSVWFKRRWSDLYQWVPYAYCEKARQSVSPAVPEAILKFDYGDIKREDRNYRDIYLPLIVQDAYVAVVAHDAFHTWQVWSGVVQLEQCNIHGQSTYLSGRQQFTAFGVEHLFDRAHISTSHTSAGVVDRPIKFNGQDAFGLLGHGNYGEDGDGIPWFEDTGDLWSNLDIATYLVARFLPSDLTIEIVGATDALDTIFEEHNLRGMSVKQALDRLINRRNGLGWKLVVPFQDNAPLYIYVYSDLANSVSFGGTTIPANPDQIVLYADGRLDVDPSFNHSAIEQYDQVRVMGGPISICGTWSVSDNPRTLDPAWTLAEGIAYEDGAHSADPAVNDRARQSEALSHVFSRFRVPDDWDGTLGGYNALPAVDDLGNFREDLRAPLYRKDKRFSRHIPILEDAADTDVAPDFRRMFAVIDVPTLGFMPVHRLGDIGEGFNSCHVIPAENELAVFVRGNPNHVIGLNQYESEYPTNTEPSVDYATLRVTAMIESDRHLQVFLRLRYAPDGTWQREKIINLPDAEMWIVLPNTVLDVDVAGLVLSPSEYQQSRDDRQQLIKVALLAAQFYSQARATASIQFKYITPEYEPGMLLRGAIGVWHSVNVGTLITTKEFDFTAMTTTITTGWEELSFEGFAQ